jgi:hypothetical protein
MKRLAIVPVVLIVLALGLVGGSVATASPQSQA